jgi:hypothetical protein
MQKNKLALALGLALAAFASRAEAIPISNGDLVVVIQKGGTELILNLGDAFTPNDSLDLSSTIAGIPAFGGNLNGAKVVAIGVDDPGRTVDFGFGALPQENIVFSTLEADPAGSLTDQAIETGMSVVDSTLQSAAWFWQLRSVSGNTLQTTAAASYQMNLGLGTDAVANNFPFSIAGVVDGNGSLSLTVYSAVRGYTDFGGPDRSVSPIAALVVNGSNLAYVPEPGTLLLVGAGLLGLAGLDRRTRQA